MQVLLNLDQKDKELLFIYFFSAENEQTFGSLGIQKF